MRCEQIMKSDVACVSAKDTVQLAAQKMRDEGVGFLPICDNDNKVLGTITDRDIAIRVCAENRPLTTLIGDVMTREMIACRPSDDIQRAQELMGKYHKSRILCVNDEDSLVGVISLSDIAQYKAEAGAKTLREVSEREVRP